MKLLITAVILLSISHAQCQDYEKSDSLVNKAYALYKAREYEISAKLYIQGFDALGGLAYPYDRYNAACSFALAGDSSNAFYHLFNLAEGGAKFKNYSHISIDPDLHSLHVSKRWDILLNIVSANKYEAEKDLDQKLIAILDTVLIEDQKYRMEINGIKEEFGWESPEMKAHFKTMREKDSVNLMLVRQIIDERGWLGKDVIGEEGNGALFLVIQHADADIQVNYLPIMREAVENGNAYASDLALLEDRVALTSGEKQIYGSQIGYNKETGEYYIEPIKDPDRVDERRAEVGLRPLADYVNSWGIIWDVENHKSTTIKN